MGLVDCLKLVKRKQDNNNMAHYKGFSVGLYYVTIPHL